MAQSSSPRFGVIAEVDAPPLDELSARLLDYLRATTNTSALSYATAPERILGGFETLIYAFQLAYAPPPLAGPLILRMFYAGRDSAQAKREGVVQNAVAAQGFPAPRVHLVCDDPGVLGGPFTIMGRLSGRPMIDTMIGPGMLRTTRQLGWLQARLHGLDAEALASAEDGAVALVDAESHLADFRDGIVAASMDGAREGVAWLVKHRPASSRTVLCHGDFHPINILMEGRNISGVLDWGWAMLAAPEYDVGATVALMKQGPVAFPDFLQGAIAAIRRRLVDVYVGAYTQIRPLDAAAVAYYEAFRTLSFLADVGEKRLQTRGVIPPTGKPVAFDQPYTVRNIVKRFHEITGVTVSLPGD